ncbi:MAG: class I SAM-dependent methyltransferase [Rhodospirillales bacterium]
MFHNLICKSVEIILDEIMQDPSPSVCELGNQTLRPDSTYRDILYRERGFDPIPEPKTVKEWYASFGIHDYTAIDVNEERNAVAMDLNVNLRDHYGFDRTFTLVTNNGTGEHVFNQAAVFENAHNLCKVGGFMIHCLPFYRWVEHGFYNFQPNMFTALAYQNGYRMVHLWVASNNFDRLLQLNTSPFGIAQLEGLDEWEYDPSVVAIMQRLNKDDFTIPLQRIYSGDNVMSDEIKARYKE